MFLPGDSITAGAALNLIAGTATVLLTGLVGRRLFGPTVGLVAAVFVALFPSLVMFTAALLSETVFAFFVVAVVAVLAWNPWSRSSGSTATSRCHRITGSWLPGRSPGLPPWCGPHLFRPC